MISLANATFAKVNEFLKALGRFGLVFGENKTPSSLVGVCSTTEHASVSSPNPTSSLAPVPVLRSKDTALSDGQGALSEPQCLSTAWKHCLTSDCQSSFGVKMSFRTSLQSLFDVKKYFW